MRRFEIALKALNRINSGYVTAHNRDKMSIAESALNRIKEIDAEENGMLKINIDSVVGTINFNNFTESQLATIIEGAIVAINKKKADCYLGEAIQKHQKQEMSVTLHAFMEGDNE